MPCVPFCGERLFRKALTEASDGQVQIYDLRRSYANWLEAAGIIRARRVIYMGHKGGGDITSLYEWHDVTQFIHDDAKRLKEYIEKHLAKATLFVVDTDPAKQ